MVANKQKILITGGAGFIGSNLAKKLIEKDFEVVILDDFSTGLRSNLENLNLQIIEGSIVDRKILDNAAENCTSIVHLAARGSVPRSLKNPVATFDVNIGGTLNVCEVARFRSIPIVFSSSSSVYGANLNSRKKENEWLSPISPYAVSKQCGESTVLSYSRCFGIKTAIFRLFNVYGPGQRPEHQYSAVIPKWIWCALNGNRIDVYGDGSSTRDFTYIDSVVEILLKTVQSERYFDGITNLAFGKPVSLTDLLFELRLIFPNLKVNYLEERSGDVKHSMNGSDLLSNLFPDVAINEIKLGLEFTARWLIEHKLEIEKRLQHISANQDK